MLSDDQHALCFGPRCEVRDFLDVDAVRSPGRFSDYDLLAATSERDAGFDLELSVRQLR